MIWRKSASLTIVPCKRWLKLDKRRLMRSSRLQVDKKFLCQRSISPTTWSNREIMSSTSDSRLARSHVTSAKIWLPLKNHLKISNRSCCQRISRYLLTLYSSFLEWRNRAMLLLRHRKFWKSSVWKRLIIARSSRQAHRCLRSYCLCRTMCAGERLRRRSSMRQSGREAT